MRLGLFGGSFVSAIEESKVFSVFRVRPPRWGTWEIEKGEADNKYEPYDGEGAMG